MGLSLSFYSHVENIWMFYPATIIDVPVQAMKMIGHVYECWRFHIFFY